MRLSRRPRLAKLRLFLMTLSLWGHGGIKYHGALSGTLPIEQNGWACLLGGITTSYFLPPLSVISAKPLAEIDAGQLLGGPEQPKLEKYSVNLFDYRLIYQYLLITTTTIWTVWIGSISYAATIVFNGHITKLRGLYSICWLTSPLSTLISGLLQTKRPKEIPIENGYSG